MLGPASPNPFRSEVIIALSLEADTPVDLAVYDVLGQRIAGLVSGTVGGGDHHVSWDGRGASGRRAAAGVYFCRLAAYSQVELCKIVLLD
jgi:hypothetical protein